MPFERSLIVLKTYLGDTVMASPLVRSVAAATKATDILGAPVVEKLLHYPNFRARFYDPGNLGNVAQLLRMSRLVKQGHYDAAFLVNRSFRSALLIKMAGIPIRVGHATEGRSFLLTHRVPYDEEKNEAKCYLDLIEAVGVTPEYTKPELYVSPEESARGLELVDGATVGIQPGARHDYKQVPVKIWQEIGRSLIQQGHKIALFGGPEERALLGELQFPAIDLVGKTTLRESLGALSHLKLMLGGDTGVMHLAAAVGTPTITAYGPTPAKKWGWFDAPHQVLMAPDKDITKLEVSVFQEAIQRALCG